MLYFNYATSMRLAKILGKKSPDRVNEMKTEPGVLVGIAGIIVSLAIWGTIAYVAWHFIAKYW